MSCRDAVYSNDYYNFIIRNSAYLAGYEPGECHIDLDSLYTIEFAKREGLPPLSLGNYTYASIPKCYTLLGEEALESGVYSEEIPLQVGENEIIVTLSLEGEESEYVIIVTREEEAVTEPEPTPGTDKPSIPGSDEDQVGGGDWDWPDGSGNGSANGTGSGNSDKENPSSGDSSMIAGALAVLALSAGAAVVLSRKKK